MEGGGGIMFKTHCYFLCVLKNYFNKNLTKYPKKFKKEKNFKRCKFSSKDHKKIHKIKSEFPQNITNKMQISSKDHKRNRHFVKGSQEKNMHFVKGSQGIKKAG